MRKYIEVITLFLIVVLYAGDYKEVKATEVTSVAITKENFPDKRVREEISKAFDKNKDKVLSEEELKVAITLELESEVINLQGISKLRFITNLRIDVNEVENISEIKKMPQLRYLYFASNDNDKTSTLDFCNNKNLKEVHVYSGEFSFPIKIKNFPDGLQILDAYMCKIKDSKIKDISGLKRIKLRNCNFQTLIVENCPKLEKITSTENGKLGKVILKKLPKLECLKIGSAKKLKELKLPYLPGMRELVLGRNSIKKINFKKIPNLRILSVKRNNKITKIDLRPLRKLYELTWQRGKLKDIRFGQKKNLTYMYLQHNRLGGTWKLSKFPKLYEFYCNYNRIKNIYGRNHKYLDGIECEHNRLKKLDLYNIEPGHIWFKGNPHVTAYLLHDSSGHTYYRFDKSAKVHYKWKD